MKSKNCISTLHGKIGKYIKGCTVKHYLERTTQDSSTVYYFTLLCNGEAITVRTKNPIIVHSQPMDNIEVSGYFDFQNCNKIFIANEIFAKQVNVRQVY